MRFNAAPTSLAVWLLALGQTFAYAGVYYSFPALLPYLIAQTGWGVADLAFGPTLGFLVMAALIPVSGRLLDAGHGGRMMVLGPILGAAALVGLGFAQTIWQWNMLWAVIGIAQACCLYETCFALLTRHLAGKAGGLTPPNLTPPNLTPRSAITRVTLIAGFSSTLAFPLGRWWGQMFGGQGALMVFAALVLLAALINGAALRMIDTGGAPVVAHPAAQKGMVRSILRRPAFWAITVIFSVIWLQHGILMTYILVLFEHQGASTGMATLAAACFGPAQVAARLIMLAGEARISNARATIYALAFIVLAGILLLLAGTAPMLIFGFAALQGAGAGLMSILRPVLVADLLGRAGFGVVSAAVSVGPILAAAAAPAVGAALLSQGGAAMIFAICLSFGAGALALGVAVLRTKG